MIFTPAQWQAFRNTTYDSARAEFDNIKRNFMGGIVGKSTRPWFVVDFPSLLPEGSTMFGFEIETGFSSQGSKTNFMQWLWDNTDYTTVDHEGCSRYPVEITFPPIVQDALVSGDNQLHQFFAYVASLNSQHRPKTTNVTASNSTGGCVGTHTNISTAAYRAATNNRQNDIARILAGKFTGLTPDQRVHLYGRSPYISDVARRRGGNIGGANDAAARIEFKMFHTTMNVDQFNNYVKVSVRLAELIDRLVANSAEVANTWSSTAFFEYLTQDLPRRSVIDPNNQQYTTRLREGYQPTYTPQSEVVAAA